MEQIVADLKPSDAGIRYFFVYNCDDANEANVCTKEQVAAAREKGWHSFCFVNGLREYYEGADPDGIEAVKADGAEKADKADEGNAPVYRANGQRLLKPMKGLNIIGGKKVMVK